VEEKELQKQEKNADEKGVNLEIKLDFSPKEWVLEKKNRGPKGEKGVLSFQVTTSKRRPHPQNWRAKKENNETLAATKGLKLGRGA